MKTKIPVVLTIDTEADNAWEDRLNPSVANVRELRRLQTLLAKYGAKATCLITHRVAEDAEATEVLQELVDIGGAEIGAHLHPWESPPFMESGVDRQYSAFPHEIPVEMFEQKLRSLVRTIARRFDSPTSYRAGRWGLVAEHIPALESSGFRVDTSVTPLMDWRGKTGIPRSLQERGGVDYRFAPQHPYHPDYRDVAREGDAKLLEIPVSVAFTRPTPRFVREAYGLLPAILRRGLEKCELLRPVWAWPSLASEDQLLRMLKNVLHAGTDVVNIAFHSSELMVGGSPRSRMEADVDETLGRLESMLSLLSSNDRCYFCTLSEAHRL